MPEKQKPSLNDLNTRKKNTNPRRPTPPRKNSGKNPPPDDNFQWLKVTRTLAFWIILVFLGLYFFNYFGNQQPSEDEISYSEFQTLLNAEAIKSAVVESKELRGKVIAEDITQAVSDRIYKIKNQIAEIDEKLTAGVQPDYSVTEIYKVKSTLDQQLVDNEELLKGLKEFRKTHQTLTQFKVFLGEEPSALVAEKWQGSIKDFRFKPGSTQWTQMLYYFSPWILAIAFWIFIMRRMQAGGTKGIFSFGKSRAKLSSENRPKVTFEDVAGADEAKQELLEIIEFLKEPEKFQRLGGKIPKGALLLGPPGTGKTLLAKAVSGEAGVPFFSMSGADFVEMFVGVGASRVRDLFEQGKKNAPCIIFIDEVDAVGRHRGAGLGGGHDEREQTLNQLLVEMDGFDSNEGVILIAATNRPDVLDHALLRPGRFDRQIVVDIPDVRGREGILKVHIKNIPLASGVNLSILAKGTPGFSGADLANMVNEAALLAARHNKDQVDMKDLEAAREKVMMGAERKSLILNDDEKRSTAYHEAGHALVGTLIPGTDPVHKVTIIPRGRALGATMQLPIDERHTYNREYLEGVVCVLLGGRVAEKLVFNTYTSGASSDIERGTEIARKMVCEYGMSEKLGPLSFGKKQEEIFLGREITQHRDYSERTAQMIDEEVKNLIIQAEKKVEKLLIENLDKLHQLVKILMEKEFVDHDEIMAIVDKGKIVEPSPEEVKADNQK